MKILLINPNLRGQPDVGVDQRTVPLSLLYIAAALRQAGYVSVKILDASIEDLAHKEIPARLKNFTPDIVGITSMCSGSRAAHNLARLVKVNDASCKVVVGGAYACAAPECVIEDPNIDFAVIGEGEVTVCELVRALENGNDVSDIAGLAFRKSGVPVVNPPRPPIEDIDSIPFPAWDLLDMEMYFTRWHRHTASPFPLSYRTIPVFTSRGCSYGCIYCHNIFGKRTRLRSVDNVVSEIQRLMERYSPGEIEIWDDIFNYNIDRAKQICDEIIRRGIKVALSFPCGLRADRMDEELIVKMKAAGTHLIVYGIDTASTKVQARIGRHLDLEKAKEIIRITESHGIITGGSFIFGFPGETKEEMLETIKFAKEMPFHIAFFFYLTPMPNTPLHTLIGHMRMPVERTKLHNYTKFSVNLSAATDGELKRVWHSAYAGFYLRPAQVRRIWKVLPRQACIFGPLLRILKYSLGLSRI